MSQVTYPPTSRSRIAERSTFEADKSNPFNPSFAAEITRPVRHKVPKGPDLEMQRQSLLALRAKLRGNVAHTADAALSDSIETTSASPDTADRASEIVEQDLALSLMGSAADLLEQVEAALQRIDDGSYGRCAECKTKIPPDRLEALPYATCCVKCADRQERAA